VHEPGDPFARLSRLDAPDGGARRDLTLALGTIRFEGLTDAAATVLDRRWGGFFRETGRDAPRLLVRCVRGDGPWLPPWKPGERYRVEAKTIPGQGTVVRSYHFALARQEDGTWRLAVHDGSAEPAGRVFDNAARYLVGLMALESGGFAVHGAGVRRDGRAWIFAGPSGAGKSTAVRLSMPAESLGDDFAVVLPGPLDWATCALPFDNRESAPAGAHDELIPLAGVYRIFQAEAHAVERPSGPVAQASLLSCLAFPWALPGGPERAAAAIEALVRAGKFAHLRFAPDPGFWKLLL
jgi:hypothetical protein